MGNRASKAVSSAAAGSATSGTARATEAAAAGASRNTRAPPPRNINLRGEDVTPASETKSSAILRDASDPSSSASMLSKNLASLGQADVRSAQRINANRFRPNMQAANVLQRRAELEEAESSLSATPFSPSSSSSAATATTAPAPRNRLTASSLTTLLDARKEITSAAELRRLCADFNCDVEMVERLAGRVTSPSVSLVRSEQQEKEDTYLARWVDPQPVTERIG